MAIKLQTEFCYQEVEVEKVKKPKKFKVWCIFVKGDEDNSFPTVWFYKVTPLKGCILKEGTLTVKP